MTFSKTSSAILAPLRLADPDCHAWVVNRLAALDPPLPVKWLPLLAKETLWGLSLEKGLALAVAGSMIDLITQAADHAIQPFIHWVHDAAATGATLARILATHLGPVLTAHRPLVERFRHLVAVMQAKGTYTLNPPLELLSELLAAGDTLSAETYLGLLAAVFQQPMSYNHCQRLVYQLPGAIRHFPAQRRAVQIQQLQRVAEIELDLMESFLDGMQKGMALLPQPHLKDFVDQALVKYSKDPKSGDRFLSLSSTLGRDKCAALQVAAPLSLVQQQLSRYLNARLGRPLALKPLSTADQLPEQWICSDGQSIFLTQEIRHHNSQSRNIALYKTLVRFEAGFFEYHSFNFDIERATANYPAVQEWLNNHPLPRISTAPGGATGGATGDTTGNAGRFFQSFAQPDLADDLFMILELGRLARRMTARYPGLMRRIGPDLKQEAQRMMASGQWPHPLTATYQRLVPTRPLDPAPPSAPAPATAAGTATLDRGAVADTIEKLFHEHVEDQSPVEVCALILCLVFDPIWEGLMGNIGPYVPFPFPFGIRLHWNLIGSALGTRAEQALELKTALAEKGLSVYKADLQYHLLHHPGAITAQELKALMRNGNVTADGTDSLAVPSLNLSDEEWEILIGSLGIKPMNCDTEGMAYDSTRSAHNAHNVPAFFYPEWDHQLRDFLQAHTRVQEITPPQITDEPFYQTTLDRHHGLVAHMRRAFEWLRPEGLAILRQWPEGDAFDYRALLDFAVDRRTGRIPSDRLYIQRLKQERDVAVLLLVDLSRSTSHGVFGKQNSVLDLTKEALVLFCEALEVVGDHYALAGFSGTGRLGVDYYPIKGFHEPLTQVVQNRISALYPQRSTRMGAAIRHATGQLQAVTARVRLMLIISDGFPNDLGYKGEYAIADTRKAIQEARSKALYVKAVTVNIGGDPKLDALYGRSHSHVIEDVSALPEKLLRLYSALTRYHP